MIMHNHPEPLSAAETALLFDRRDHRPVHFVGIAGAGMSALAELFFRRGIAVSGCDANVAGTDDLVRLGIPVQLGHDPSHVENSRALVITSAMPKDHPELAAARSKRLNVIRRAEALGAAVNHGRLVAVAGTHGKTTTTTMTTEALANAGLDPTGVVGARVAAWSGNLRRGGDDLFVVEADEYDRSFLTLQPMVAVITNVEADHLDIYEDLDDIRETFGRFAAGAKFLVRCDDDAGARSVPLPPGAEVIGFGVETPAARLVARDIVQSAGGTRSRIEFDGKPLGELSLRLPGLHNVRNALAAIGSGLALGASFEQLAGGLARVAGAERRFQVLGEKGGVLVVDDYAHHPTEIRATLAAARAAYPDRRLVAAFQPHLYTRTRDFSREFGEALALADVAMVADLYPAREQPIPGVTAALVARATESAGRDVAWEGPRGEMAEALARAVRSGDIVITLGAGDVTKTGPELLALLP